MQVRYKWGKFAKAIALKSGDEETVKNIGEIFKNPVEVPQGEPLMGEA